MTARSTIDPSPPWTTVFPPVRSRASSRTSQTKPTGKRPKNGSRSNSRPNQKSTTSLAPQGSIISTTTATYSGGTTLRRYTTPPSQKRNSSPPLLTLSLPSSTPPSIPIDTDRLPPGHDHDNIHGPCPHGCNNRSDTPITSVSLPVSQPVSNPSTEPVHVTIEPIFPSDPLDIYPTNTSSGSRRSSTLSKEWRHDPKRNEKAQKAASRIIEGCYSRKKRGKMWRMRDRVRTWGREFRKRHDKGERLKKRYVGGGGGGAGPKEEEARWSWRSGWKGKRGAENAAAAAAAPPDLEETQWPGLALGSGDDGILSPPPPIPKPPRNSVVMERLAEVLGASSTETSFGFRRRDYLRQAEEKDTLPKNRRYADAYRRGVHEKHEKMQDKVKQDRTSGLWKQGLKKFKYLKLLVSPESRTTYSASRPATPRIAIKTKIVDTSLLHPHWKGRHLESGGHSSSESRAGTLPSTSHTRSKGQPSSKTQPPAMEVPETTTTTTMDPNGEPSDKESMVAPPTYRFVDSTHNVSHGGNGKVPSRVPGAGKGKEIDYKLYHEDSVFKTQTPGFVAPRQGYKERCDCKGCNPIQIARSPSDGHYKHPHCEGNGRHENQTSLPSSTGNVPSVGRPESLRQLPSYPVDVNDFTQRYSSQSLTNVGTTNAPMLRGSMRSTENAAQISSSLLNSDDYSSMNIDTREPPMHLPSGLPTYEFPQDECSDKYALPPVVPTIAFSQIQEFSQYTIPTYTGDNSPGTFEESRVRSGPTRPSYRTGGSLEEQDNDIMFVKTRNVNKQPDDFVEGEGDRDTIKGEKAYHSTKKGHGFSEKSIEQASKPTSRSKTPTKTPSWILTNTPPKPPPKPNRQRQETPRSQRLFSKNDPYSPRDRRRIQESEEDQDLRRRTTTTRGAAQYIYDHYQGRDSHENEHDETHDNSGRAPSYVGTGQRPPKLFFTRPRPRALAALASASSSSSSSASVSAALPSPVPEEDSITANFDADIDQQHDSDSQQIHDNQSEKKHRHSHHSHHTNRYSKSSSNSNNRRSSRSSWTLSISTISTRASSPHSYSSRSHKASKRNSKTSSNKNKNNRHSTGSINDVPHAGPSTWYKTTPQTNPKTNRKRSSTASTTGTTATGFSRVSSLDKVTSNESSPSLKTHVHTYTRSHSHSRTRSGQTTGTVDTIASYDTHDSQDSQDSQDSHDSHDTENSHDTASGEGRHELRHTRTASVQVDSDLLIIPLEEVEDYVLPPSFDSPSDAPSNAASEPEGDGHPHKDNYDKHAATKREDYNEADHRGSWEWERRSPTKGYVRGDGGGGGWRIVNGADGNHVRVRVKEVGGEGSELSESVTTSTSGTGLWMKDSRGTIGTVRTVGTEGTERLEVGSYGSYGSVD